MGEKFFLGIADNDRFSLVVMGDLSGQVIATSTAGSVNYHYWGMKQARTNLKEIVGRTVGWDRRSNLAGACITYKADFTLNEWNISDLFSGCLDKVDVTVEDFATSSLLGMSESAERLFLVGGHSGQVIFEDSAGKQRHMRTDSLIWNPLMRLDEKLQRVIEADRGQCLEALLSMKSEISLGNSLDSFTAILDELVSEGSSLSLELAHDIAFDLVQMAVSMAKHFRGLSPQMGLYGQMLLGSQTIRSRVHHLLELLFPYCRIVDVPLAPAIGAYLSSIMTRRSNFNQELIINSFAQARKDEFL